jgi:uncharacterized membrane protein YqhA
MGDELKVNVAVADDDSTETKGNSNDGSEDSLPKVANRLSEEEERALSEKVAGRTRFVATVPATGLLIASVVIAIGTIVSLVVTAYDFVIGEIDLHELIIGYVEYADAFLLAVALYILSIGLLSLFISDKIPLPAWLEFHDFNDLKERLTSVIIVMIGVSFLGQVLDGPQGIDILWLGLGCAAMIAALSVFMKEVFKSEK